MRPRPKRSTPRVTATAGLAVILSGPSVLSGSSLLSGSSVGGPLALAAASSLVLTGCPKSQGYVGLRLYRTRETPRDAHVYIDERYIGPLGPVIRRGIRFPVGEHRITVKKEGYFPWDKLVEADRETIKIQVELVPIPD